MQREALHGGVGGLGIRPVRQDAQVVLVALAGLFELAGFLQRLAQAESRQGVIGHPLPRAAVAADGGRIVLPLEIEIADFDVLVRPMRIVEVKLVHVVGGRAAGMIGVSGRRAQIDLGGVAGTHAIIVGGGGWRGALGAVRRARLISLPRLRRHRSGRVLCPGAQPHEHAGCHRK